MFCIAPCVPFFVFCPLLLLLFSRVSFFPFFIVHVPNYTVQLFENTMGKHGKQSMCVPWSELRKLDIWKFLLFAWKRFPVYECSIPFLHTSIFTPFPSVFRFRRWIESINNNWLNYLKSLQTMGAYVFWGMWSYRIVDSIIYLLFRRGRSDMKPAFSSMPAFWPSSTALCSAWCNASGSCSCIRFPGLFTPIVPV